MHVSLRKVIVTRHMSRGRTVSGIARQSLPDPDQRVRSRFSFRPAELGPLVLH